MLVTSLIKTPCWYALSLNFLTYSEVFLLVAGESNMFGYKCSDGFVSVRFCTILVLAWFCVCVLATHSSSWAQKYVVMYMCDWEASVNSFSRRSEKMKRGVRNGKEETNSPGKAAAEFDKLSVTDMVEDEKTVEEMSFSWEEGWCCSLWLPIYFLDCGRLFFPSRTLARRNGYDEGECWEE